MMTMMTMMSEWSRLGLDQSHLDKKRSQANITAALRRHAPNITTLLHDTIEHHETTHHLVELISYSLSNAICKQDRVMNIFRECVTVCPGKYRLESIYIIPLETRSTPATMSKQRSTLSKHKFDFVAFDDSTMLLRHCCWCGRHFTVVTCTWRRVVSCRYNASSRKNRRHIGGLIHYNCSVMLEVFTIERRSLILPCALYRLRTCCWRRKRTVCSWYFNR